MALSKTTQDHDEIRTWAEARGAKPAEVASTEKNGQTGILRIEFPKATNHNDANLKEISWDEFFEKFDASGLALVYQNVTKEGAESNFNKLIHPDDVAAKKSTSPAKKTAAKSSAKTAAKSSASTKSAASTKSSAPAKSAAPAKASKTAAKPAVKAAAKSSGKTVAKAPAKKSSSKSTKTAK